MYLAVDFGVVSRLILNVPVPYRVCRESENSFVYVPIEEKLTEKMTFRRGEYVGVTGWLSPVFVDFWQAAIIVRSFKGVIRGFRTLGESRGVLTVEVTGKGGGLPRKGKCFMVFEDFAYDRYYASSSLRIDDRNDSFTVWFRKTELG